MNQWQNEGDVLFSIIITAYNRKEYLKYAIDSINSQTLPRTMYEVIVVKNFDDEETDVLIKKYGFISLSGIGGRIGEQLHAGIEKSSGHYICFLDDDDLFTPDKLEVLSELISMEPDLCYYHNSQSLVDEEGTRIPGFREPPPDSPILIQTGTDLRKSIKERPDITLYSIMFNLSSTSIRRDILTEYLDDIPYLIDGTDWFFFYLALASNGKLYIDPRMLTLYRIHKSTSNIFLEVKSIKSLNKSIATNYLDKGHWATLLKKMIHNSNAESFIDCRLLEENFVMKGQGVKFDDHLTFKDCTMYITCLIKHNRMSLKVVFKSVYSVAVLFVPSAVGFFYNLYTYHLYQKGMNAKR